MQLSIVLVTFLISAITALLVYQKNPRSGTNVYFSLMVFFISAYPVFNYLAIHAQNDIQALIWAKVILLVSIPQGPLLYFFAKAFPDTKFVFYKRRQVILASWVAVNWLLAVGGLIFKSVSLHNSTVSIQPGPLVPSFGVLHASTIIIGLLVLYKKYRHQTGANRRQLGYVFYGILVSFSLTFLITFILPIILKNTLLLAVSPLFLALSVAVVAYAIVAQHLFDIRAAVARSAAYVLVLGTVALAYSAITFGIINVVFAGTDKQVLRQVLAAILVAPLALGFQSLKNFFNQITNRLFYKDNYNLQEVLDELGHIIVVEIDLTKLLNNSRSVLEKALKSSFIEFVLFQDEKPRYENNKNLQMGKIQEIGEHIKTQRNDLLVKDELSAGHPLRDRFNEEGIALSLRLKTQHQVVGYVFFGEKRSGDIYNNQDRSLLLIAANELAVAIQNALRFEEIERFNVTLQEKVDVATRKLRQTNEKLRQMDETKDEFISMASHQLRTPLTSVKGYMSMVLEGDAGKLNAQQHKLLDQAFTSSQRMVYLIADLLNVSRLKTGKFVIDAAPTNLSETVAGEISQLVEAAKSRNLELTYHKPKDFPVLMLDETKIRQVIMNFIDNAIYYTPSGGHIQVNLTQTPETVEFTVVDDGLGVPRADQHHLFSKFYRANNAKKARPDGTGLGLFMAKKVIVAQGGAIIFKSQEGKGSTFGFSFPKKQLAAGSKTAPAATTKSLL